MLTAEEIVALWTYRKNRSDTTLSRMRRIRDVYNGDVVLPFIDETEPAVANLILMGIDQKAARIASVMPQLWFPPDKPGQELAEKRATKRREAVRSWWEENDMPSLLTQRARHFIAYGHSIVVLSPDLADHVPRWKVRNPLACFMSEDLNSYGVPQDFLAAHNKPFAWLRQNYPQLAATVNRDGHYRDHSQVVLLEYIDQDELVLVFGGVDSVWEPGQQTMQWETNTWGGYAVDLVRMPNRIGRVTASVATRPTLDRRSGEFDQAIGMYGAQAKLTALELDAIEKDIYPDTYLVSRPNEIADFVKGPFDGRTGEVNIVKGGEVLTVRNQPGWMTGPMTDRLERAQRLTSGIPAEFGGESTTNVRTGRRGDAILSAVVDFPLAEAQSELARSMQDENAIAIALASKYWPDTKVSYHFMEGRQTRSGDYTPGDLFSGVRYHRVHYPVVGSDANNLVVGIGQRLGLGIMSRRSAAELDPIIEDAEFEFDRITSEALEAALLSSVQQAAAGGMLSPAVVGRIMQLVRSGTTELAEAIEKALAEEAQRREAEQPQGTGMEEAMAAQAAEGMGEPEGIPPVAEAGQGLQNLQGLMQALRRTNTRSAGREVLGGAA